MRGTVLFERNLVRTCGVSGKVLRIAGCAANLLIGHLTLTHVHGNPRVHILFREVGLGRATLRCQAHRTVSEATSHDQERGVCNHAVVGADRQALQRLIEAAEKAKIELSSTFETTISLPFIALDPASKTPLHLEKKLTRAKFEELIEPLLKRLRGPVEQALKDAGLTPAQIDARVEEAVTQVQDLRAEAEARIEEARTQAEEAVAAAEQRAQELQAQAEQQLQEAQDAAIAAAESARRGAVWSALFLAVSSLVAGLAAWMGAIKGGSDRDAGRVWGGLSRRRT